VFDLERFDHFYAFMLEDPYRLVIDVYAQKVPLLQERKSIKKKKISDEIKTIVIDPGHGGKDPGAIGPRGLKEKDVVLDIAKKLGRILKEKYNMRVIYTRTKDIFIPLNERTEIANSNKADLFISIHTNASRKRYTRGIETYILNWTNDEEAMRVAARENAISYKKMRKVQNELQIILQDLARNNKRDESIVLARSVQDSMIKTLKRNYRIIDLGVKQALFYVLVGAEMPSILVEVSFITNREEEKRLSQSSYRSKIAAAIAKGIINYINTQSTLVVRKLGDST
jgi:N-acetylmuramoyl-L-alanine amidase